MNCTLATLALASASFAVYSMSKWRIACNDSARRTRESIMIRLKQWSQLLGGALYTKHLILD